MSWLWLAVMLLMVAGMAGCEGCGRDHGPDAGKLAEARRRGIVRGNMQATHAYQILLARAAIAKGTKLDENA